MNEKKKEPRNLTDLFVYLVPVIWFGLAAMYFFEPEKRGMATTYFAIGAMWLFLGLAWKVQRKREKITLDYYNENVNAFISDSLSADVSELRARFAKYLPEGATVLDWGCGSGRDTKAFIEAGYQVDAVDASDEMVKRASEYTGIKVKKQKFSELEAKEKYDGIWACASLLHVEKEKFYETIDLARRALKPGGVIYISYKYGEFEGERDGRFYCDMTEEKFDKYFKNIRKLQLVDRWVTGDVRSGKEGSWLNVIIKKTS